MPAACQALFLSRALKESYVALFSALLFLCPFKSNNPACQTNFAFVDTCPKVTRTPLRRTPTYTKKISQLVSTQPQKLPTSYVFSHQLATGFPSFYLVSPLVASSLWISPLVVPLFTSFTSGGSLLHGLHLWWPLSLRISPLVVLLLTSFTSGGSLLLGLHLWWPSSYGFHLWWSYLLRASPLVALYYLGFTSGGLSLRGFHLWWSISSQLSHPLAHYQNRFLKNLSL